MSSKRNSHVAWNGLFSSAGIKRMGIPEMKYTDGPFGSVKSWKRTPGIP